jgi:hypothetical protein
MCLKLGTIFWQSLLFIDGDRSHNEYTLLYSFLSFYLLIYSLFSIETNEWNKHNDAIGSTTKLPDGVKEEDFIGAEKESSE